MDNQKKKKFKLQKVVMLMKFHFYYLATTIKPFIEFLLIFSEFNITFFSYLLHKKKNMLTMALVCKQILRFVLSRNLI